MTLDPGIEGRGLTQALWRGSSNAAVQEKIGAILSRSAIDGLIHNRHGGALPRPANSPCPRAPAGIVGAGARPYESPLEEGAIPPRRLLQPRGALNREREKRGRGRHDG